MKNFAANKDRPLRFTAPAGGVVSGTAYLIGAILVVAVADAAAGDDFGGLVEGVVTLPKASGAITEGAKLYWDNTAGNITTTATNNTLVGFAGKGGAASGDAAVLVVLNGTV